MRGPIPLRSRDEIAGAAVALADASGLDAVTMRRLAAELGSAGASLYRYVASRDELLDLMVDRAMRALAPPPPTGRWQEDVVALGRALLAVHRRHRWLVDVRQGSTTPGPSAVDLFELGLGAVAPVAAGTARLMEAVAMLVGVVTLFAQQEAHAAAFAFPPIDADRWPLLSAAFGAPVPDGGPPAADLFDRVVVGVVAGVLGEAADR